MGFRSRFLAVGLSLTVGHVKAIVVTQLTPRTSSLVPDSNRDEILYLEWVTETDEHGQQGFQWGRSKSLRSMSTVFSGGGSGAFVGKTNMWRKHGGEFPQALEWAVAKSIDWQNPEEQAEARNNVCRGSETQTDRLSAVDIVKKKFSLQLKFLRLEFDSEGTESESQCGSKAIAEAAADYSHALASGLNDCKWVREAAFRDISEIRSIVSQNCFGNKPGKVLLGSENAEGGNIGDYLLQEHSTTAPRGAVTSALAEFSLKVLEARLTDALSLPSLTQNPLLASFTGVSDSNSLPDSSKVTKVFDDFAGKKLKNRMKPDTLAVLDKVSAAIRDQVRAESAGAKLKLGLYADRAKDQQEKVKAGLKKVVSELDEKAEKVSAELVKLSGFVSDEESKSEPLDREVLPFLLAVLLLSAPVHTDLNLGNIFLLTRTPNVENVLEELRLGDNGARPDQRTPVIGELSRILFGIEHHGNLAEKERKYKYEIQNHELGRSSQLDTSLNVLSSVREDFYEQLVQKLRGPMANDSEHAVTSQSVATILDMLTGSKFSTRFPNDAEALKNVPIWDPLLKASLFFARLQRVSDAGAALEKTFPKMLADLESVKGGPKEGVEKAALVEKMCNTLDRIEVDLAILYEKDLKLERECQVTVTH